MQGYGYVYKINIAENLCHDILKLLKLLSCIAIYLMFITAGYTFVYFMLHTSYLYTYLEVVVSQQLQTTWLQAMAEESEKRSAARFP